MNCESCYVLHTSSFQTASCTGYKGKSPTAHCFMSGTQRSHRFLTTTWSTSFPGSVLVHSPCADGTRSKLKHWITHHLLVLCKEGNSHDSCVSLVCFSHLQSNGFHKVFLLSAVNTDFLSQIKPSIQTCLQLHLVAFNEDIFFLPEPTQVNLYCQLVSPFHVTKD